MEDKLVQRFMERFHGLDRAHGVYTLERGAKKDSGGKLSGRASTIKKPVTRSLWKSHLEGKIGLGIVPVNDEGLCSFGAGDIDQYSLDLNSLDKRIQEEGLPLILCKSKSGGAHFYLFFKDRAEAKFVKKILGEWATLLGYPSIEIFPKQDKIEKEDDAGSWINMPYFNTDRHAVRDGKELSAEEFLDLADRLATTQDEIRRIKVQEDFSDGPPCLQILTAGGFEEGTRNQGLFNIGVYLRKKDEDSWEDRLEDYNYKYMTPPLKSEEIKGIKKSLRKKNYFYQCNQPPIISVCDKKVCSKREFGVTPRSSSILRNLITKIEFLKTDPPIWLVTVKGHRIRFKSTEDLQDQRRFAKHCFESPAHFLPPKMKEDEWREMWNDLHDIIEDIYAPQEAGVQGEFLDLLEIYCTEKLAARNADELLIGKPYTKDGFIYLRSKDMLEYMRKKKMDVKANIAYSWMRDLEAEPFTFKNLKGKDVRTWKISSTLFTKLKEPFDIPEIKDDEHEF